MASCELEQPIDLALRSRQHGLVRPESTQVFREIEGRRVAPRRLLLERFGEDGRDLRGERRIPAPGIRRIALEHRLEQVLAAAALERPVKGQAFVERHSERVHVRAPIEDTMVALELLGRHVRRRPKDLAALRDLDEPIEARARETEIQDDWSAIAADHHVAGLDIPVDEAQLVGLVQRACDCLDEEEGSKQRPISSRLQVGRMTKGLVGR
jgi:hypothetical protein